MTLSPGARLFLYNLMAALPIFIDFAKNSQDFTLRGMVNPSLNALYAMVIVTLAKTAPVGDDVKPKTIDVSAKVDVITPKP